MKNILIIITILLSSCYPLRNIDTLDYSFTEGTILYKGEPAAKVVSLEYSYDNGKMVREITLECTNIKYWPNAKEIITFVHNHLGKEIEVEIHIPMPADEEDF